MTMAIKITNPILKPFQEIYCTCFLQVERQNAIRYIFLRKAWRGYDVKCAYAYCTLACHISSWHILMPNIWLDHFVSLHYFRNKVILVFLLMFATSHALKVQQEEPTFKWHVISGVICISVHNVYDTPVPEMNNEKKYFLIEVRSL